MSEEKINETEEQAVDKKDEKLKNQSSELDYLTNTIIPKLKKNHKKQAKTYEVKKALPYPIMYLENAKK